MAFDLPFSPAAERNAPALLDVLSGALPARARVLEIASGTGQHAAHFGAARPLWQWQPSDGTAATLLAIAARCAGLANVQPPLLLDVLATPWPTLPWPLLDAVLCANMVHIAPWAACVALLQGVAPRLRPGGVVLLYGPFRVDGEPTAASNEAFDADLRRRDPAWGLRRLADVVNVAQQAELAFERRFTMPANNLVLLFRRAVDQPSE